MAAALPVLALALRVSPAGVKRPPILLPADPQALGARRTRAWWRTVAAPPVTRPAEQEVSPAARAPAVHQVQKAAGAAPMDLPT
jgi:hypothetical protein